MSRINKTFDPIIENKPKLYYGIGVFYAKIPDSSKWGFRASLDFNIRGAGTFYEGPDVISSSTSSINSTSVAFYPTLHASNKLHFFLGPQMSYILGGTKIFEHTYYETEAKEIVMFSSTGENRYNDDAFVYRLHFGLKAGLSLNISKHIDLGLTYQYARMLKYELFIYEPFYNIINISTNIYFKSRE